MHDNFDDDDFMRDDRDLYEDDEIYDDYEDDYRNAVPPCYGNCPMMQMTRQQNPPFGSPPFGPPSFGPQSSGPPSSPPPNIAPQKAAGFGPGGPSIKAVDPGAIRPCRNRFVYIWLENGRSFWAWLTFVGRRSVAGWRWNGRRWVYFGIDLDRIESFQCY